MTDGPALTGPGASGVQPPMDPYELQQPAKRGELKIIRQSTIGSAEICLKRGAYSHDPNRPYSTGERRAQGTGYHAGLETFFGWCLSWDDGKIVPPDDALFADMLLSSHRGLLHEVELHEKDQGAGTFLWETSYQETVERVQTMLMAWRQQQAWPDPATYKVIGVEQEWWAPFTEGWVAKGSVDLILQNIVTGRVEMEDHKTAGKRWPAAKGSPRSSPQPGTYAWAWWRLTGEMPARFHYGVMTTKGVFERRSFDITPAIIQKTVDKTISYLPFLELPVELLPGNTTSILCSEKWCDNWGDCPFGAAFDGPVSL